jgi:hypothetical protein
MSKKDDNADIINEIEKEYGEMMKDYGKMMKCLDKIYVNVGTPLICMATLTGFTFGLLGEINASESGRPNSAITSFVNITGLTFIGIFSGYTWPISMPLLSMGAIYNRINKK